MSSAVAQRRGPQDTGAGEGSEGRYDSRLMASDPPPRRPWLLWLLLVLLTLLLVLLGVGILDWFEL